MLAWTVFSAKNFMKKFLLCFVLVLLFFPCFKVHAAHRYLIEYDDLTQREKHLMDTIYDTMNSKKPMVNIDMKITNKEYDNVEKAIDSTWLPFKGHAFKFMGYFREKKDWNVCHISVCPKRFRYFYIKNERCRAITTQWTKKCVKKGMSTGKKRDAIGKYLAKKMSYSSNIHSAEKALKKRRGACDAYAVLYNAMCKSAGITSARCCLGIDHEFNTMKIGKKRYYVDVTFYDTGGKKSKYLHMTKLTERAHRLLKDQSIY